MSDVASMSQHEAVERLLAAKVQRDPNFMQEMILDPAAAVAPLLQSVTGSDDVDLEGVSISVHVETENTLHFVVPVGDSDVDEVSGFSQDDSGVAPRKFFGWGGAYRGKCDLSGAPVPGDRYLHTSDVFTATTSHPGLCGPLP